MRGLERVAHIEGHNAAFDNGTTDGEAPAIDRIAIVERLEHCKVSGTKQDPGHDQTLG